jgi:membrane-associated phospholipid phosphatase
MNIGIKDVLQRIRLFFIVYLILLITCLVIKLIYSREEIYFAVNSIHSQWADWFAPYLTDLGEGWTIIILSAIWALFNYRQAFLMATSYGVTAILAQILKPLFHAPRPELYFKNQLSRIHFVNGVEMFSHNSFPSGHTVTAFSAAVVATYLCKNKNWGLLFLLIAILIGYSRMYLSEHFFEDVTAGSVIGVIVTVFWVAWLDSRKFLNAPGWNRGCFLKVSSS